MLDSKNTSVAAMNFLKRFGENAPAEAKRRAQEMQLFGRPQGYATWMLILEEIKALISSGNDNTVH
ncbi:MAG: hypothetical protein HN719_00830 [Alphaproteobacteria bacterium]|nr:hypothetical protein [Alphaproteobacteria bacterium]